MIHSPAMDTFSTQSDVLMKEDGKNDRVRSCCFQVPAYNSSWLICALSLYSNHGNKRLLSFLMRVKISDFICKMSDTSRPDYAANELAIVRLMSRWETRAIV